LKTRNKARGKISTKILNKQNKNQKAQASTAQKNTFWTKVRRRIEKHKFYPRIAQKRGVEGIVKVKFTILKNGRVSTISVRGSKMFYKSAKEAVRNAFPISVKNIPIRLPKSVTLPIHYNIR
jgi:protein TonB